MDSMAAARHGVCAFQTFPAAMAAGQRRRRQSPTPCPPRVSGSAAAIIPVVLDEGRTVRANLTFDAGLLAAIDAEAARCGLTRSAFLASAARKRLALA